MIETDRFEKVEITSRSALREWLSVNHGRQEGVWLVRYKKSVPSKFVDRLAVLDELLCFGWIDGVARKLDGQRTMQLITPRRQQAWAQSYKTRVERLEAEGRMAEAGRAAIARGKASGLWDAYVESDQLIVPPDLASALAAEPQAESFFQGAAPSYRRNVLRWIGAAKRAPTRARRVGEVVQSAKRGEKIPQM